MDNINKQLETINGILDRIDAKQQAINDKLDEVIKALHEYDDENNLHCEYSGLPSVKTYDEKDIMIWDVDGAERRMDIIGQNGNTGEHYENEIINKPATTNVEKKKRDKRNKWVSPYPPNPKRNVNKNNAG
jgi:hypothetical protein